MTKASPQIIGSTPTKPERKPFDQEEFSDFYYSLPSSRRKKDEGYLQALINQARHYSPSFTKAHDWASVHGIKFFIDYKHVESPGYYPPGTGVTALCAHYLPPASLELHKNSLYQHSDFSRIVNYMTHEIRHGYQDYNHLLARNHPGFTGQLIHQALYEADAHAHGTYAMYETSYHLRRNDYPPYKHEEYFLGWFRSARDDHTKKPLPKVYGLRLAKEYALHYEIDIETLPIEDSDMTGENLEHIEALYNAEDIHEFTPENIVPRYPGNNNLYNIFNQLNKTFDGTGMVYDAKHIKSVFPNLFNVSAAIRFHRPGESHPLVQAILAKENSLSL